MLTTLPAEVLSVVREFRACEFSTLARDGTPIAWPASPRWEAERGVFILTTSIGFPQKAFNIRRSPKVALLFSDPTASGLSRAPAVLVQGEAAAPDKIVTTEGLSDYWRETIFARQPASALYSANALTRWLADWYYLRLIITVTPRRLHWWPDGNFARAPEVLDVG